MAGSKKSESTLEQLFFSTPAQKVLKLLLTESTTSYAPRIILSRLKGVRGLGGAEGLTLVLAELHELGMIEFVDNQRAVRLHDDHPTVQLLKRFSAICDLESLRKVLEPICSKGLLFGSRATGRARSDSDYDLFVVSKSPEEAKKLVARHPFGKAVELVAWTPEQFDQIELHDPGLKVKLENGFVLWGAYASTAF